MWLAAWVTLTVAFHGVVATFVPHIHGAVYYYGYQIPNGFVEQKNSRYPYTFSFYPNPIFYYQFTLHCAPSSECVVVASLIYTGDTPSLLRRRGTLIAEVVDNFRVNHDEDDSAVGSSIHPLKYDKGFFRTQWLKVAVYTASKECKVRTYVYSLYWKRYGHFSTVDCETEYYYISNPWALKRWQQERSNTPWNVPIASGYHGKPSGSDVSSTGAPPPSQNPAPPPKPQHPEPKPPNAAPMPPYAVPKPQKTEPNNQNLPPKPQNSASQPQNSAANPKPPVQPSMGSASSPETYPPVAEAEKKTVLYVRGVVEGWDYIVPANYRVVRTQPKPNDKQLTFYKYCIKDGYEVPEDESDCICTALLTFKTQKVEAYRVSCDATLEDVWGSIFLLGEETEASKTFINIIVRLQNKGCYVRKFRTGLPNIYLVKYTHCHQDPRYQLTGWAEAKSNEENGRGNK